MLFTLNVIWAEETNLQYETLLEIGIASAEVWLETQNN